MEHVRWFYAVADTKAGEGSVIVCVNDDWKAAAGMLTCIRRIHCPAVFKVIMLIRQERRPLHQRC